MAAPSCGATTPCNRRRSFGTTSAIAIAMPPTTISRITNPAMSLPPPLSDGVEVVAREDQRDDHEDRLHDHSGERVQHARARGHRDLLTLLLEEADDERGGRDRAADEPGEVVRELLADDGLVRQRDRDRAHHRDRAAERREPRDAGTRSRSSPTPRCRTSCPSRCRRARRSGGRRRGSRRPRAGCRWATTRRSSTGRRDLLTGDLVRPARATPSAAPSCSWRSWRVLGDSAAGSSIGRTSARPVAAQRAVSRPRARAPRRRSPQSSRATRPRRAGTVPAARPTTRGRSRRTRSCRRRERARSPRASRRARCASACSRPRFAHASSRIASVTARAPCSVSATPSGSRNTSSAVSSGPPTPAITTSLTGTPARCASKSRYARCSSCCVRVSASVSPESLYQIERHTFANSRASVASRPITSIATGAAVGRARDEARLAPELLVGERRDPTRVTPSPTSALPTWSSDGVAAGVPTTRWNAAATPHASARLVTTSSGMPISATSAPSAPSVSSATTSRRAGRRRYGAATNNTVVAIASTITGYSGLEPSIVQSRRPPRRGRVDQGAQPCSSRPSRARPRSRASGTSGSDA